jgi:hypothetical protein
MEAPWYPPPFLPACLPAWHPPPLLPVCLQCWNMLGSSPWTPVVDFFTQATVPSPPDAPVVSSTSQVNRQRQTREAVYPWGPTHAFLKVLITYFHDTPQLSRWRPPLSTLLQLSFNSPFNFPPRRASSSSRPLNLSALPYCLNTPSRSQPLHYPHL